MLNGVKPARQHEETAAFRRGATIQLRRDWSLPGGGQPSIEVGPSISIAAMAGSKGTPRMDEVGSTAAACAHWIRAAVGGEAATVRIAVPDRLGKLRVIASFGHHDGSGRLRSSRRRRVFDTGRPFVMSVEGSTGLAMGILPIGSNGHSVGVVEILAPRDKVIEREDVLLALVGQLELLLGEAGVRAQMAHAAEGLTALSSLATEMIGAKSGVEAVRRTVDICFQHVGTPVAGLLPDRDGWGWFLAATGGLGTRRRAEFRSFLRVPNDRFVPRRPRIPSLRLGFQEITGSEEVVAVRAGEAVLLFGNLHEDHRQLSERAGSVLATALIELSDASRSRRKNRTRDVGIALIAHELKGPLVGVHAAIDRACETDAGPEGRELLRRTRDELRQLADLVDPLLQWSIGTGTITRQPTDLVPVVRDAVTSSSLGSDGRLVEIEAVDRLVVLADAQRLRGAISNIVRNSLAYSPADEPIKVLVERAGRLARIEVRDHGPGVPADERQLVFDPFERGRLGQSTRAGSGLGLFVARRVLEAHGGTISLRPTRSGAAFRMELPMLEERSQRFAS